MARIKEWLYNLRLFRGPIKASVTKCVGREEELERCARALEDPYNNGILQLCGKEGMGKEALLSDFERMAREKGFVTVPRTMNDAPSTNRDWAVMLQNDAKLAVQQLSWSKDQAKAVKDNLNSRSVGVSVGVAGTNVGVHLGPATQGVTSDPTYLAARALEEMGQLAQEKEREVFLAYYGVDRGFRSDTETRAYLTFLSMVESAQQRGLPIVLSTTMEPIGLDKMLRPQQGFDVSGWFLPVKPLKEKAVLEMLHEKGLSGVIDSSWLRGETSGRPRLLVAWCEALFAYTEGDGPISREEVSLKLERIRERVVERVGGERRYAQLGGKAAGRNQVIKEIRQDLAKEVSL